MIEITIPQDIREFEPTLIGFLTTRQFICGAAACALAVGGYFIEKGLGMEDPLNFPIFLVIAVPPVLIGWMKPFGMKFEQFIVQAFRDNLQAPNNRPYVIENCWDEYLKDTNESESSSDKKEKKNQTPRSKLPEELRSYR